MTCLMEDECPKIHTVHAHCPTNLVATISGTLENPSIALTCVNGSRSFSISFAPRHLAALTDIISKLNDHMDLVQKERAQQEPFSRWCMHTIVVQA